MRSWQEFNRFTHKLPPGDRKHPDFKHLEKQAFDTCFWAREEHAYKLLGSLIDWAKARECGLSATAVMYPTRDLLPSSLSSPLLFVVDKQKKGVCMAFLREDSFHHGYAPYHNYAHYSHLGKKYTISYPSDLFSEYNTSNPRPDRWLSAFFTQFTFRDHAPETYSDAGMSITIPSHHNSMSLVLAPSAAGDVELGMSSAFGASKEAISAAFMAARGKETPSIGHYIFTFEGKSYLVKEDGEVDYQMTNSIELHKKFLDAETPAHAQAEKILMRFFARAQRLIVKTSEACGAEKIADLFQSLQLGAPKR